MHVFVTGATGWVGSAVVDDLIVHGHRVTGLSRSVEKAGALADRGATVVEGTLDDLDLLARHAAAADATFHLAFNHDFSKFAENGRQDRRAIETMGAALKGSDKPLLVTSGVALLAPGHVATEADRPPADPNSPRQSEEAARALAADGLRTATVRLAPSVHGVGDQGFMMILAKLARETGVSAYVGDGANRWPGCARDDAATVYRLALDSGVTMPAYHAVAEQGVAFRDIAAAIGRQLGLPTESRGADHFGWFARFAAADMPASSEITRSKLGWVPTGPDLIQDIDQPAYFRGV